ncbi:NfeD family protein [Aquirhabdus parva]|uniref:NfeD family protein n=1 Tax=Aquirhabdus parva TaxID=2283318 RepID=A0A345P631_9GAMM|nr:NfeD family protein [Aquirhabdus parva]AXI02740.1 NfeD family protein [Aquirhabdus parva]
MSAWVFWLIISSIMLIAELMTGILFCLCLSLAALITVAVTWILPPFGQGIVFAILSTIFLIIWARWRQQQTALEKPVISEIQHHLIDHVLILSRALEPTAQVRVGDSFWLARTEDGLSLAEGTKVKVIAIEGTVLVVRAID